MRTRILHLADLHLGQNHGYLSARSADRQREADGILARTTEWILSPESRIGGVLLAGDIFDHHTPPDALVESVLADLYRLHESGIRILTVPGNHDEYSYPEGVFRKYATRWPGHLVTNPTPARVVSWELGGRCVDLYSMAYVAGRSSPPYDQFSVEPGPACKVAVLHGSLDVEWSDRSLPLSSSRLAELGLDYIALGHIHRPRERRLGRGWVVYPGRIEGGGFDDPGGADLVSFDPCEDEPAPRHHAFRSRPVEEEDWSLGSFSSEQELYARFESACNEEKILRINLRGIPGFPVDPGGLAGRFGGRFYHLEVRQPEGAAPLIGIESLIGERTIRGEFARIAAREGASCRTPEEQMRTEMAFRQGLSAFLAAGPDSQESATDRMAGQ